MGEKNLPNNNPSFSQYNEGLNKIIGQKKVTREIAELTPKKYK